MKTSKYTSATRKLIREGKPTGYTLAAKIVATSTGRVSVSGNVPIHWLTPEPDTTTPQQRLEAYRIAGEQTED